MNINFSRFTIKSRNVITRAFALTKQCQYADIEPQVLMVAILQESDEMVSYVLNIMRVDKKIFCSDISNSMRLISHRITSEHDFSPSLQLVMRKSIELAGSDMVSLEHMFWALGVVDNPVRIVMVRHGINSEMLRLAINSYIHRRPEVPRTPVVHRTSEDIEHQGNVSSTSDDLESTVTSFVDKLKDFLDSKFVLAICAIVVIIGILSELNDSSSNNSLGGSSYRREETMVSCPICGGSGRYNSTDIFKSQMSCTGCGGRGTVPSSQAMDIMKMHTPSTPSSTQNSGNNKQPKEDLCKACRGSGFCHVCFHSGGVDYGGIKYCSACGNTGRCRHCYGRGRKSY